VIFPQPANLFNDLHLIEETDAPEEQSKEEKAFLLYVYIASGCALALLAGIVATYCCCRRQKEGQEEKKLQKRINKSHRDISTINGNGVMTMNIERRQPKNNQYDDSKGKHPNAGVYTHRQLDAVGDSSGSNRPWRGPSGYAGPDQDRDVRGAPPPEDGGCVTSYDVMGHGERRGFGTDGTSSSRNNNKPPSQRYWSTSGRHTMSTSGRRILDAATRTPTHTCQEGHHHGGGGDQVPQLYAPVRRITTRDGASLGLYINRQGAHMPPIKSQSELSMDSFLLDV
jgi:hypothetical protein